jgi:hypothetical protein
MDHPRPPGSHLRASMPPLQGLNCSVRYSQGVALGFTVSAFRASDPVTSQARVRCSENAHPSPKNALLNIRVRSTYLLSELISSGGPPRYVGPRRFCSVWACLAHCTLYHTNTCNTRNPSAKTCAPG